MHRLRVVILLSAVGLSATARAGGLEFPDNGAISIGRGGAVAANPTDGEAIEQNPAGLGFQHGLHITVDGNITKMNLTFKPAGMNETDSNQAAPFLAPGAIVSYGFRDIGPLSGLTFALGAVGPSAIGKLQYSPSSYARYQLLSTDYFIAYYSAAVAATLFDKISIGGTFQLAQGTAAFSQAAWSGVGQSTSGPDSCPGATSLSQCDTIASVSVKSGYIPTGVIGATFAPFSMLAFGASFRPAYQFEGNGTLTSQLPKAAFLQATNPKQVGDSASLLLDFPNVFRLGAQVRPTSRLLVEANFVWEGWSSLQSINVVPHNIEIDTSVGNFALPQITLPESFTNLYSIRIGADYALIQNHLVVRAGYLHETSGIPTNDVSISFGDWGCDGVSGGVSLSMFGASLDIGYEHLFVPTQTVTNSQVVQVITPGPMGLAPKTSVVGNGTYTNSYDVFAIGLRFALDDLRE